MTLLSRGRLRRLDSYEKRPQGKKPVITHEVLTLDVVVVVVIAAAALSYRQAFVELSIV